MTWILVALAIWAGLSLLGLAGVSAVCRSGHLEDVARGFTDSVVDPYPVASIPAPAVSPEPPIAAPSLLL